MDDCKGIGLSYLPLFRSEGKHKPLALNLSISYSNIINNCELANQIQIIQLNMHLELEAMTYLYCVCNEIFLTVNMKDQTILITMQKTTAFKFDK